MANISFFHCQSRRKTDFPVVPTPLRAFSGHLLDGRRGGELAASKRLVCFPFRAESDVSRVTVIKQPASGEWIPLPNDLQGKASKSLVSIVTFVIIIN